MIWSSERALKRPAKMLSSRLLRICSCRSEDSAAREAGLRSEMVGGDAQVGETLEAGELVYRASEVDCGRGRGWQVCRGGPGGVLELGEVELKRRRKRTGSNDVFLG